MISAAAAGLNGETLDQPKEARMRKLIANEFTSLG
jgi:hypothetical protein